MHPFLLKEIFFSNKKSSCWSEFSLLCLFLRFFLFSIYLAPLYMSQGAGLGNKFLDDLRHADVLMHILDVSGTTNEKGEATVGYDPINDAQWLHGEIHGKSSEKKRSIFTLDLHTKRHNYFSCLSLCLPWSRSISFLTYI